LNNASLEHNLKIYSWYQAAAGFYPWLPVFFLFFYQYVDFSDALRLGAIYYFSVFLLEVPSGYFSDRFGRRVTLILSAVFGLSAYSLFIISDAFNGLALGQFFMAASISFKTGSDNAILYDSLRVLEREDEYAQREASGTKWGMISLAAAALIGGLSGMISLTLPYYLSAMGAVVTLWLAFQFNEPPVTEKAAPFFRQLAICFTRLKDPFLLWIFAFFIILYSLSHIPAEFNQPYILLLDLDWVKGSNSSAMVSGVMVAISMLGGAFGAAISIRLLNRYGVHSLLIASLACIIVIIGGMAAALHPIILSLVLFRNFPMALSEAPMLSAISPRIDSGYRATYISLQSLAGRLGFSLMLFSLSSLIDTDNVESAMQWPDMQSALGWSLGVGVVCLVALLLLRHERG